MLFYWWYSRMHIFLKVLIFVSSVHEIFFQTFWQILRCYLADIVLFLGQWWFWLLNTTHKLHVLLYVSYFPDYNLDSIDFLKPYVSSMSVRSDQRHWSFPNECHFFKFIFFSLCLVSSASSSLFISSSHHHLVFLTVTASAYCLRQRCSVAPLNYSDS